MPLIIVDFLKSEITEIEGKIPSIIGLATTAALNVVKNEIPNVSDLIKKTNYVAKNTRY